MARSNEEAFCVMFKKELVDASDDVIANNPFAGRRPLDLAHQSLYHGTVHLPTTRGTALTLPLEADNVPLLAESTLRGYHRLFHENNVLSMKAGTLEVTTDFQPHLLATTLYVRFKDMVANEYHTYTVTLDDIELAMADRALCEYWVNDAAQQLQAMRIPKIATLIAAVNHEMEKRYG